MKDLISNVIALDKNNQQDIAALNKEKNTLSQSLKKLQRQLEEKYARETIEKTNQFRLVKEHEFEAASQKVIDEAAQKQTIIQNKYNDNKDHWIDDLFAYCLK